MKARLSRLVAPALAVLLGLLAGYLIFAQK
jgi:hypothetical protein